MKKSRLISFALFVITICPEIYAQGGSNELYPELGGSKERFKSYLQSPYPVKDVLFVTPGDEVLLNGHALKGDLVFQGALQEKTFYLRNLGDRPGQPANYLEKGVVAGRTTQGLPWKIDDAAVRGTGGNIDVTIAGPKTGPSESEGEHEARMALFQLHLITQFGMAFLVPDSVTWNGDNFSALFRSEHWPANTNCYAVSGRVVTWTNNMPLAIRLWSTHWPKQMSYGSWHYTYDFSIRTFPIDLWSEVVLKDGRHMISSKRRILDISFGKSEDDYTPRAFFAKSPAVFPNVFVSSNSATYWVHNGKVIKVGLPPSKPRSLGRVVLLVVITLILVLAASIVAAFLVAKRKQIGST